MDDSVDRVVAAAGTAGSAAAQPDTVVRTNADASSEADSQASSGPDDSGPDDPGGSGSDGQELASGPLTPSAFAGSKEPVTVSMSSPVRSAAKADSSSRSSSPRSSSSARSSASGSTPPPSSSLTSPRWTPSPLAGSATEPAGSGLTEAAASVSSDAPSLDVPSSDDAGKTVKKSSPAAARDRATEHDDMSGRPVSPSGTAVLPPVVNEPEAKPASTATLAAAALASDPPSSGSGYSAGGYSDYQPAGYSSRDPFWPSSAAKDSQTPGFSSSGDPATPAGLAGARSATAGYPPATADSSRPAGGYTPADSPLTGAPPSSASTRPSSIWTSQEPTSGRIGYSPSGARRPDDGTVTAAAAGAAAAGAAAAATQLPGRVVASKLPMPNAAPPQSDDLVSKLKAPFGTVTKKRKPVQPRRPAGSATGIAPPVRSKPSAKRSPVGSVTPQSAGQEGPDSRRDAQLVVSRVEPWSVMKFSFIVSLVGWVVVFVAVALLYYALRAFGVFHFLEQTVTTVTSSKGHAGSDASAWFSTSTVLGFTMLAGAINVVLFTALATVGAVIYNIVTHLAGGVEVTLREAD